MHWVYYWCRAETMPPGIASCVYQVATVLTVSGEAAGGPVENVSIRVIGPALGPATCTIGSTATTCTVPGEGGARLIWAKEVDPRLPTY